MAEDNFPENPKSEFGAHVDKVVMMPKREEMVRKLQEAEILGLTPQSDRFYNRFIDSVAASEKVGVGLNLAWELAMYDTLRNYPPMIQTIMNMNYDRVIDIVTPDPEVAAQAKEVRKQILEQIKKEQQQT